MNFVFLSPNFPKTYWHFTQSLKNNGVTTLGIGDEPYENLSQELNPQLHSNSVGDTSRKYIESQDKSSSSIYSFSV